MNAILGFSGLIEYEKKGDNVFYVNIIQKSIDELIKKIENIIEFSQLQTSEYVPVLESFSVEQLVSETYGKFKNSLYINNDIELNYTKGESIFVNADFLKIQSIIIPKNC